MTARTAIVTGGARSIGRACCLQLARDGHNVAVWDVNAEGAAETVRMIQAEGHRSAAYVGDASDTHDIERILTAIRSDFGPIGILINNAAIVDFRPFLEISHETFDRIHRINLKGPFILTQAAIPDMAAAQWGRVINISSAAAQSGTPGLSHYAAAKGGIIALTRTLAMEFAERGVTVNSISPSFIDSAMTQAAASSTASHNRAAALAAAPMKRAGTTEEVAAAVSFLASDGAAYITGQIMGVNGGLVLT